MVPNRLNVHMYIILSLPIINHYRWSRQFCRRQEVTQTNACVCSWIYVNEWEMNSIVTIIIMRESKHIVLARPETWGSRDTHIISNIVCLFSKLLVSARSRTVVVVVVVVGTMCECVELGDDIVVVAFGRCAECDRIAGRSRPVRLSNIQVRQVPSGQ